MGYAGIAICLIQEIQVPAGEMKIKKKKCAMSGSHKEKKVGKKKKPRKHQSMGGK